MPRRRLPLPRAPRAPSSVGVARRSRPGALGPVVLFLAAVSVGGVGGAALAGPSGTASADVGRGLAAARAALDARQWPAVVDALAEALRLARAEAPLVVRQALVVRDPHAGLGAYTPVTGPLRERELRLYVEVDNLVEATLPDRRRRLAVEVGGRFAYVGVDGARKELGHVDLGRQELALWRTTGTHSLGVDVRLGDAPPGQYHLELAVTDLVGGKSAVRPVSFTLR